jgi:hypothetical protein
MYSIGYQKHTLRSLLPRSFEWYEFEYADVLAWRKRTDLLEDLQERSSVVGLDKLSIRQSIDADA